MYLSKQVDGFRHSIAEFNDKVKGTVKKEVMDMLLLSQYFDAIREIGSSSTCRTTLVPGSKSFTEDMRNLLLQVDMNK
jgi:hypothetical protein